MKLYVINEGLHFFSEFTTTWFFWFVLLIGVRGNVGFLLDYQRRLHVYSLNNVWIVYLSPPPERGGIYELSSLMHSL
jgi:hypothetical protein